jgi:hypothetical protein
LTTLSSNDTYVKEILKALDINDTVERHGLRCLGHITNIIIAVETFFSWRGGFRFDTFKEEISKAPRNVRETKKNERLARGRLNNKAISEKRLGLTKMLKQFESIH